MQYAKLTESMWYRNMYYSALQLHIITNCSYLLDVYVVQDWSQR
jgi:hypothetical protein